MKFVTFEGVEGDPNVEGLTLGQWHFKRGIGIPIPDSSLQMHPHHQAGRYVLSIREAVVSDIEPSAIEYTDALAEGDITALIPNYRALDLTRQAVESFKAVYPKVPLVVVDDGSADASTVYIRTLPDLYANTRVVVLDRNVGHGAALHMGIGLVRTKRVWTMDSDVVIRRPGFLELMESRMIEADLYAIGMMYWRDYSHHNYYVTCVAALYDMERYRTLPPFMHDGDPMQANMDAAHQRGYKVEEFPVLRWMDHLECGTRKRYGYRWDMTGE